MYRQGVIFIILHLTSSTYLRVIFSVEQSALLVKLLVSLWFF
ncbi:hypothetical protein PCIT_b0415 [Pseudoalteromonas citrea]|uniref:Uncharacterized protein n=1 Tax=Pseudoalteromonas citrea TaxID=43655 RepID=A0AAD4FPW7_9GAMM|nr:hypothetical protein PCIT_b0415 [Pseudoalteromonas citrea]